jgi:hypothetical protein
MSTEKQNLEAKDMPNSNLLSLKTLIRNDFGVFAGTLRGGGNNFGPGGEAGAPKGLPP